MICEAKLDRQSQQSDQRILEMANGLLSQLRFEGNRLERVIWASVYRGIGLVLPDQPAFRGTTMILAIDAKEELTTEDWRPLIASSIFYDKKFRLRRRLGTLTLVLSIILTIAGAVLFSILVVPNLPRPGGPSTGRGLGGLLLFVTLGLGFAFAALLAPYMRSLRFHADRLAILALGMGDELVKVLMKIDAMALPVLQRQASRFSQRPTPRQRIRRLSSTGRGALGRDPPLAE